MEEFKTASDKEELLAVRLAETEAKLQLAQAKSHELLGVLPDLVFFLDADGIIVDLHANVLASLALPPEDFLGKPVAEVLDRFPPEVKQLFSSALDNGMSTGKPQSFHFKLFNLLGTLCDFEAVITRGRRGDAIFVIRDITEFKKAEEDLIRAKEAAESATRAKSDFLAEMSFEILTTMNGIIGMSDLILAPNLTVEQKEYLEVSKASAYSLLSLINDILDLSKIDAQKLEFRTAEILRFDQEPDVPKPSSFLETRPLRVLLAEDNRLNQKIATRMLEKQGHSVVLANNGQEALEALEMGPFDLVLMDVQMPVMDGLEATKLVREKGLRIPIVAMTAHAMTGDKEDCLAAGMNGYLAKPIQIETLRDELQRILPPWQN
ncbi:MAG TPA: hypothetical protein DD435_07265 [Cyanobacteria bacterium UBA8530]|nr:hypothetical protein [Cyanobacteria bacterium UBA8530]